LIKRLPKYTNKYCEAIGDYIGVRFTRIESSENFEDIFPYCLNHNTCKRDDCIFKVGERGKLYFDWPQGPATYNRMSS
jgi:hypothetical protein